MTDQQNILLFKVSNLMYNSFITKLLMALKMPVIPRIIYSFFHSFSYNCLPELICSEKHHNSGSYSKTQDPVNRYSVFK